MANQLQPASNGKSALCAYFEWLLAGIERFMIPTCLHASTMVSASPFQACALLAALYLPLAACACLGAICVPAVVLALLVTTQAARFLSRRLWNFSNYRSKQQQP